MSSKGLSSPELKPLLKEAASRSPTGHFCHLTSAYYHGLTNQIPTWIYLRKPKSGHQNNRRKERLTDLEIRKAFLKPHRQTGSTIPFGHGGYILVSGKASDQIGVIPVAEIVKTFPKGSKVTNLERCLIDAVVAPHYNGGIYSLPELFEQAAENLNIDKLIAQYHELDYLYPYHQALGFFLHHTGQHQAAEKLRRVCPPTNRFFVDKNAKTRWAFDSDWNVYYPPGLIHGH